MKTAAKAHKEGWLEAALEEVEKIPTVAASLHAFFAHMADATHHDAEAVVADVLANGNKIVGAIVKHTVAHE